MVRTVTVCCLAAALPLSACYHYVPAATPAQGAQVRAELGPVGAESLVPHFGPGVSSVTGTYLGREEAAVSLLVSEYFSDRIGNRAVWNESIRVPLHGIEQFRERRLHVVRSALFAAAVAGAVAATFVALDIGGRVVDDIDTPEPGPGEMRLPRGTGVRTQFRLQQGGSRVPVP